MKAYNTSFLLNVKILRTKTKKSLFYPKTDFATKVFVKSLTEYNLFDCCHNNFDPTSRVAPQGLHTHSCFSFGVT